MIETCTYSNASEFLSETCELLEADEARNNLMLGLANVLVEEPLKFGPQPFFAVTKRNGEIEIAALMTPPHKLILCTGCATHEAYQSMCDGVHSVVTAIPGVIGPSEAAGNFAKAWSALAATETVLSMRMRVYKLTKVASTKLPNGQARKANPKDAEVVAEWIRQFNRDVFNAKVEETLKKATQHIADGTIVLWEDGMPVSMSNRCRETKNGFVVNMVFTPQELRSKGYATACVSSMCNAILSSGKQFCTLFTDLNNPTSNSIYQKIGFMPIGDFHDYAFTATTSNPI